MDNQDTRDKHMEKISDACVHVMSNRVIYKFQKNELVKVNESRVIKIEGQESW